MAGHNRGRGSGRGRGTGRSTVGANEQGAVGTNEQGAAGSNEHGEADRPNKLPTQIRSRYQGATVDIYQYDVFFE